MSERHPRQHDAPLSAGSGRSREELLALGAGSPSAPGAPTPSPWRFVPQAIALLERDPADHLIRLLLAANLARLALRTPALEHVQHLLADATLDPRLAEQARALAAAASGLPDDRITPDTREHRARQALDALADRLDSRDDAERAFKAWRARATTESWFATLDGNVVRREEPTGLWRRFADDRGMASALSLAAPGKRGAIDPEAPAYVATMDTPWMALRCVDLLPRAASAWWAPIAIVEPDPLALLDALACITDTAPLAESRLRVFTGAGAFDRLASHLAQRDAFLLRGSCVTARPDRADVGQRLAQIVSVACERQSSAAATLRAALAERHRERDTNHWAQRFARTNAQPLRVLIPTTRLSTYVRHASADAADAFRALGCDARLLIEPDDASKLSSVAFLREIESFDPDLVVLINYTRSTLAKDLPRDVPLVTWVQDAMFHLFAPESWADRGPHDFIFGHLHRDFFDRFGVPRAHTRPAFVPASETKFHPAPIDDAQRQRFACDIAMVTNHAETPEALLARFLADASVNPIARRLVEAIEPRVRAVVADAMNGSVFARLDAAARDTLAELKLPTDDASVARLLDQVAYPFADRLLRHEAAHWAAELAETHGWRLRLYGAGWDRHPTLARFAAGPLPHAEELRAAYQAARITLHVSLHGHHHQRVVECALSGGLPLARRTGDAIEVLRRHVVAAVSRDRDPSHCLLDDRSAWTFAIEHPQAMRLAAQLQRLALKGQRRVYFDPRARQPEPALRIMSDAVAWLMGDLCETTFDSRETLETLTRRSIESDAWRRSLSAGIADRARGTLTYRASAQTILDLVRSRLGAEAEHKHLATPALAGAAA